MKPAESNEAGFQSIESNKKAYFNYEILEKLEVGIVLTGCEVKSIRAGHITIRDSFARVVTKELWLFNCTIQPYTYGNRHNPDPVRNRKLLIHRAQLAKWEAKVSQKGLVLVPVSIYFKHGKVKLSIGLGKPKKLHDKRQSLKEKSTKRELDRAIRNYQK